MTQWTSIYEQSLSQGEDENMEMKENINVNNLAHSNRSHVYRTYEFLLELKFHNLSYIRK